MGSKIRIGKRSYDLPRSRILRTIIGVLLILSGILGFLPVVGFWMIPLGLIVLSADWPFALRVRRRIAVWWGRKNGNYGKNGKNSSGKRN
ncbi:MAG: hypothetical protein K8F25_03125 [Fimbriimonadaceae bacterium]|nr:hypothetical protein [Alphaproteobacteria bacterium]